MWLVSGSMAPREIRHKFTVQQLMEGVSLSTGSKHIIEVMNYKLRLRLEIDPNEVSSVDDRFTLFGGKNVDSRDYQQVKTTEDDLVEGDDYVDLCFTDLIPDLNYWLEIDPGKEGEKYYAFENEPWSRIKRMVG